MHNHYDALKFLRVAVEERGADYVYPDELRSNGSNAGVCLYQDSSREPLCIVGNVANQLGLLKDLSEGLAADIQPALKDAFTLAALNVLATAQQVQDNGKSWGTALIEATKVANTSKIYQGTSN